MDNPLADFRVCVVSLCSKYTEGQYARQSPGRTLKRRLTLSVGSPFLPETPPRAPEIRRELQASTSHQRDSKCSF